MRKTGTYYQLYKHFYRADMKNRVNAFIPNVFQPMANLTRVSKCFIKHFKIADHIRLTEIKLGVYSEKLVITEAAQQKYWPWIEAQICSDLKCYWIQKFKGLINGLDLGIS